MTAKLSGLAHQLGRFAPDAPASDGDLLARFVATRDEPAFAELVRRYGPLVFAVCRRVTGSHHLAEDAFQAVFVVLAAKAGSVRPAAALPAFLHSVATRTALRARTVSDRRRRRETPVAALPDAADHEGAPAEDADLATVVDEEISRLPDALRVAVVLCEMEGCSRRDAAARLGVPEGTVSSRLAAARKALAARLRSRGVALGAAGLSAALGRHAAAGVPAGLGARALASALSPGVVPEAVSALSTGVLRVMFAQKLKTVLPLVTVALGALACAALAASHDPANPQPPVPAAQAAPALVLAPRPAAPVPKAEPDPLPKGPNRLLVERNGLLSLIDPDGKNETKIDEKRGEPVLRDVLLSPDGKSVAGNVVLPANGAGGPDRRAPTSLHVRNLDEKSPGTDLGVQCRMFIWSPDGTEIVCSEFVDNRNKEPESEHCIVNVKTKQKTALKLPANNHIITDWSRDGKYFLTSAVGMTDGKPAARLCLMNRDGSENKMLTDDTQVALLGRFSADGKRVLFTTMTLGPKEKPEEAKRELAVMNLATGKSAKVEDVPLNAELQSYCWSPDGKKIAYCWREIHTGTQEERGNKETETHLIVCDPSGKNAKTVLTEKGTGQWHVTIGGIDWR